VIKTEGIILKSTDSNEIDRFLTVYSKKLGKVLINAKGVKKLESKLRYSIEPISYVQMILVEGKNFLILKDAVLLDQFLKIKKDLQKIKIAKKLAEMIDEAMAGEEKDEDVWFLILKTIQAIDRNRISGNSVLKTFQKNLIKLLGYDPEQMKNLRDIY